jgi:subtilisin family serine protease
VYVASSSHAEHRFQHASPFRVLGRLGNLLEAVDPDHAVEREASLDVQLDQSRYKDLWYAVAFDYPTHGVMPVVNTVQYDRQRYTSNYGYWVDIAAPRVSVYSTIRNGYYSYMTGTNMSSPHVTGLAGLLASQERTKYQSWSQIRGTAVNLGARGFDQYCGYGRINVYRAGLRACANR